MGVYFSFLLNIKLKGLIGFPPAGERGALNILVVKNESLKALRHLNVLRPKGSCAPLMKQYMRWKFNSPEN